MIVWWLFGSDSVSVPLTRETSNEAAPIGSRVARSEGILKSSRGLTPLATFGLSTRKPLFSRLEPASRRPPGPLHGSLFRGGAEGSRYARLEVCERSCRAVIVARIVSGC